MLKLCVQYMERDEALDGAKCPPPLLPSLLDCSHSCQINNANLGVYDLLSLDSFVVSIYYLLLKLQLNVMFSN